MKKYSKFVLSFVALVSAFLALSLVVFAEEDNRVANGEIVCSGRISGTTAIYNPNAGKISFDAHPTVNQSVSLAIVGQGAGLAPGNRDYAACSAVEPGIFQGNAYQYTMKGWAWNDNLGFVSFSCRDENNSPASKENDSGPAGSEVACGNFDYGVYIGPPLANGNRELFGYAWSPSFGWVQFKGQGANNAFNYGVIMDPTGNLSGYAWTNAGVYMNFAGVHVELPNNSIGVTVINPNNFCQGKPYICAQTQNFQNQVALTIVNTPFSENGGVATVRAVMAAKETSDVTVDLNYGGTARYGSTYDYTLSATQVVIPAGAVQSGPITINAVNDTLEESNETVDLTIIGVTSGGQGVKIGYSAQPVTGIIVDDDSCPVTAQGPLTPCKPKVKLSINNPSVPENQGQAQVTASLSGLTSNNVTVSLTYAGSALYNTDYSLNTVSVTIPAGQTQASANITTINDTEKEGNETVILDIDAVTNGSEDGSQSVNTVIIDDDPTGTVSGASPIVSLVLLNSPLDEQGSTANVKAVLSKTSSQAVTVNLAFAGTATNNVDYTRSGGQIVINSGATEGTIDLRSLPDSSVEGDETVITSIASVTNGTENGNQAVTAVIKDDDGGGSSAPAVSLSVNGSPFVENGGVANVIATLTEMASNDVTVNLTFPNAPVNPATNIQDYTRSAANMIIPAGQSSATITLTGVDDSNVEGDENVVVDILSVSNASENGTQRASAVIADDESGGGGCSGAGCSGGGGGSGGGGASGSGVLGSLGTGAKIADGADAHYVHIYLRDQTATGPLSNLVTQGVITQQAYNNFINSVQFEWKDTVKLNQVIAAANNAAGTVFENDARSFSTTYAGVQAAVLFKPLRFSIGNSTVAADISNPNIHFYKDLADATHFISKPITSYAPTSDTNFAYTTSTQPPYTVPNEKFIYDIGQGTVESNDLVLKRITHNELRDVNNNVLIPQNAIYPNGQIDTSFSFKPPISVKPLYVDAFEDQIVAYRGLPVSFKVGADIIGTLPTQVLGTAGVSVYLAYSQALTQAQSGCGTTNFNFHFINNFTGQAASGNNLAASAGVLAVNDVDLQAVADLPPQQSGQQLACNYAQAPTFYSVVNYKVGPGKIVEYYSDKLPRIGGQQISNPVVTVHGNIYGQAAADISSKVHIQSSGSVTVSAIRDSINENLATKAGDISNIAGNGKCTVTKLSAVLNNNFTVVGCNSSRYRAFTVGNENVLYFKGSEVTMSLTGGDWSNDWVVISDKGNIFIDGDIYKATNPSADKLSLIAFRDSGNNYFTSGNVYVAPFVSGTGGVKNIQAIIIADGTLFPYNGDHSAMNAKGEPNFLNQNDRITKLASQLLIEGAIYSDNTIGGADLDRAETGSGQQPKSYLLLGGGETINASSATAADRLRAQNYDLNYLRLFALGVEINPSGLPIDQKCGKGLTPQEISAIYNGQTVCGSRLGCSTTGGANQSAACDGINATKKYDPQSAVDGDLVTPQNPAVLAKGLNNNPQTGTDFGPVYIYYVPPDSNSFVFSKQGAINISGN